ncbi:NACHT, LRR and PYD domains-containing protein 3-like [Dendronephthya gigantea]|uniref:NACHT, LRR and PYD domains-containing protein 3-like n=1 Tax=Dendronephthya gigantea TaxID=151771 RepID=UPI00106DBFC7|nr:NACHT, LRR and PYD domains-containing protein 3-like [Dendronephthya gigantea]
MLNAVKDYLTPKTFSIPAYVCLIAQLLCGLVVTSIVVALRVGEFAKFNCAVGPESAAPYKPTEKTCYSRYEEKYNSPLPFYAFVILSNWFPIFVGVIYSLSVRNRVEEICGSNDEPQNDAEAGNEVHNRRSFYVFYSYVLHLVIRLLFGLVFTILQYAVFFRSGFDFEFSCDEPASDVTSKIAKNGSVSQLNSTTSTITCENSTASEKNLWAGIVCALNTIFAAIIFVEVIHLSIRFFSGVGFVDDTKFTTDYFSHKRYAHVDPNPDLDLDLDLALNLDPNRNPVPDPETSPGPNLDRNPVPDSETSPGPNLDRNPVPDSETSPGPNLDRNPVPDPDRNLECINSYKEKVLAQSLSSDITYGPKTGLDDLFIDVVIHTERARHNFPTKMDRHEIFDVYMKVPDDSIRLEKVKDLFYPNEDTEGKRPRKILAVGRPGIGKTVLTEKIMRDWAKQIDEFYSGMIAFHFKFRLFNRPEWHHDNLKNFLRFGTACDEEFERIFDYITKEPEKALLIFDGLDEFDGNIKDCLDQAARQNNPDICMPAISLFIKLISGHFLPGATILVTTRPTASDYSKFRCDRNVEIIGFTSEKIEHYVIKFCENHNRSDLKPEMWNHINSSSDLLNLCYIPVNSFIVSTVLFKYFTDRSNETAVLPTTLTELYQAAIKHFDKDHYRKTDGPSSKMVVKNLQSLAYEGILHGQLVFNEELIDEEMRRSGLLNKLSNPIHPEIQEQFCFIHLTVQEFLAAKHVTETQSPEEIKNFICSNVKDGKWHLVLQFIAGILGQKKKTCGKKYQRFKDCVLAFAESFRVDEGELAFGADYVSLFVMKCFREAGDEDIVKEACERTAINVGRLSYDPRHDDNHFLSSSEWAAVIFVCKCIKELKVIEIVAPDWSEECYREFCVLLQQRCIKELVLVRPSMLMGDRIFSYFISLFPGGLLFKALKNLKCTLDHEHSKLTKLNVRGLFTEGENLSMIVEFFEHGHASCLKTFGLGKCRLTLKEISEICKLLVKKLCPELTYLDLFGNFFRDEGVRVLCKALIECCQLKLTGLNLNSCSLTDECIPSLCELFKDEHCNLTFLDIGWNSGISDEGVRMLCEDVLKNGHCKLAELNLGSCSLTDQCIPWLSKALLDKRCVINRLGISQNNFTANGKNSLRELEANQDCKARGLVIYCRDRNVIFSINMSGTD